MPFQSMASIAEAAQEVAAASDLNTLERIRLRWLGKKGVLTEAMQQLGQLSPEARREAGQLLNERKSEVQSLLQERKAELEAAAIHARLQQEHLDVTLPGRREACGSAHPIRQTLEWIEHYFFGLGFEISDGPEIEDDYHNFAALNIPEDHPARAMHDTFYLDATRLLRTQTSTVQIRFLESHQPPLRMIATGRVYRRDSDITHTPMFHQVEGLLLDERASFADLRGLLSDFLHGFSQSRISRYASVPLTFLSRSLPLKLISAASSAAVPAAGSASRPAGWRCWAAVWCIRRCWRVPVSTASVSAALPLGWVSSVSPCCVTE